MRSGTHVYLHQWNQTKTADVLRRLSRRVCPTETLVEVEGLIQNMCQNQYNKIGDDEEELVEKLEVLQQKEQHEGIKRLQEEDTESKGESTQATKLEVMMIQFTTAMGEHMTSSRNEIQRLTEEMSRLREQCQAIELRNRKINPVERPTQRRNVEAIETQDSQTQGIQEDTEELDGREEPTEESEPTIQENPQPTQTPPTQTVPRSPVLVQPYPSKNEKKETQKEIDKKIDGYMNKTEISVPIKDLLRIAPPFNKYMKKL
ncbi:hypothetical protein A2U01_0025073, partial [Trifolium medium]|nr:hypothetical protein [Trifolium medium]